MLGDRARKMESEVAAVVRGPSPSEILRDNAGARMSRVNSETGAVVTIYDGRAAGMDTSGGRYQVVCETHGSMVAVRTLSDARRGFPGSEAWCDGCRDVLDRR